MIVSLSDGYTAEWNGGHYINFITPDGQAHGCMSFLWEQNKVSQIEAIDALLRNEQDILDEMANV